MKCVIDTAVIPQSSLPTAFSRAFTLLAFITIDTFLRTIDAHTLPSRVGVNVVITLYGVGGPRIIGTELKLLLRSVTRSGARSVPSLLPLSPST